MYDTDQFLSHHVVKHFVLLLEYIDDLLDKNNLFILLLMLMTFSFLLFSLTLFSSLHG